ncbi:tyrosine-type recombinase/integrase, partial [Acidimicrobiales bacterium]|nr:tyrosine-type recombinase/integrase [Acidimicrobiales bacterium]
MRQKPTKTSHSEDPRPHPVAPHDGPGELTRLSERVQEFVTAARSPATLRAYRSDWEHFTNWCADRGLTALPAAPETVAVYLAELADTHAVSTIGRRVSSVSQAHRAADLPSPTDQALVRETHRGIRNTKATEPVNAAQPLRLGDLKRVIEAIDTTALTGARDAALLLVGWWGALRRSELVAVAIEHLETRPDGYALTVPVSKTDQTGAGHTVAVPRFDDPALDPVQALQRWLDASAITTGTVFRSIDRHGNLKGTLTGQSVTLIVKRCTAAAGLQGRYSGHSLRAGLATSAAEEGLGERSIMRQTRHRSTSTVRRYIRDGDLFHDSAAAQLARNQRRERLAGAPGGDHMTAEEWMA